MISPTSCTEGLRIWSRSWTATRYVLRGRSPTRKRRVSRDLSGCSLNRQTRDLPLGPGIPIHQSRDDHIVEECRHSHIDVWSRPLLWRASMAQRNEEVYLHEYACDTHASAWAAILPSTITSVRTKAFSTARHPRSTTAYPGTTRRLRFSWLKPTRQLPAHWDRLVPPSPTTLYTSPCASCCDPNSRQSLSSLDAMSDHTP